MSTDPLAKYNAKRDFAKTAEPAGTLAPGHGNRFIVQKHDASRLHWDFRLEVDGVLKSWAVTRGPSIDPDQKRLAVRTEDHPLSYADFEGTIPQGEYGGGTVMQWDSGTWAPIAGKSAKDIEQGHLHFVLEGERMKGEWMLIRLKPRGKEKGENWLLRKVGDAEAGGTDTLVETGLTSVTTGRTMAEIAEGKKPSKQSTPSSPRTRGSRSSSTAGQKRDPRVRGDDGKMPVFQEPQLCTLVDAVPTGNQWLHEVKYDGYRALIAVAKGKAKVFTRSGLDWTDKFQAIADAVAKLPVETALLDGEIVAFKDGKPDFSTLKNAISSGGEMTFFAFDLLHLDGEDLTGLANTARKERLEPLIDGEDPRVQYSQHIIGQGEQLFETMCREGYEGVVSKRADAPYRGKRTQAWLKIKCTQRQEFVIVGWTTSAKSRGFASLLLGLNGPDGLIYAGKVGTGFSTDLMMELRERLEKIERKTPTVKAPPAAVRGAHWVKPQLVAEVAYAETTPDGVLRHSSFLGLREDKAASEVVAETPAAVDTPATAIPETHIKVSNRDRVIFPESNVTKGELADYYAQVSSIMLPFAGSRPISLVRCPQGRAKACFFQKHDAGSFKGDHVHKVPIPEKDGSSEDYLYVDDADGLVACVQMGTIEFHGWGSSVGSLEQPDRMVFDLDPDEELGFDVVKKAAADLKEHLAELGLVSFAMLSGGKGVHVVVPLMPQAQWPAVEDFAERFARALGAAEPDRFLATMSKAKRKGRIFIDWLRNQRGATAVLPYVARARAGAPVAAPVSWSELRDIDAASRWGVRDAAALIMRAGSRDLAGWGIADQVLPDL
ncbi:DNA ligase D [Sphingomonas sp. 10B4]|uniref:DNA ligase D n=1 Tax=Sphingomonas sp. 10B4 TaxID=3048575 RepID=UPI002AB51D77|nr:DNA ligase D [Sphingomonas sp. 10B4]MDY7522594.1 DNA ligase D [Sphingomonas sp. 10B4]MEB0283965.1 DNA ligase D [Sphingomonas sp. 10B4]